MACVPLEGQGLGLAIDPVTQMFSSDLGAAHPLLLPSPGWIQTLLHMALRAPSGLHCFSCWQSQWQSILFFSIVTDLRIELHRLVRLCIYPWGRIKVLATPKPQ